MEKQNQGQEFLTSINCGEKLNMAKEYFIQKAIGKGKKGALRATVMRQYGKQGFTEGGNIRFNVLQKLSHKPGVTGKRARFALTLRKF